MDRADEILLLSTLVVLIALVYVGSAAVDRPWFAWVVLFAALPLLSFIPPTSGIDPSVVLLIVAAVFLAAGAARGLLRRPGGLPLQAAGMLVFGARSSSRSGSEEKLYPSVYLLVDALPRGLPVPSGRHL